MTFPAEVSIPIEAYGEILRPRSNRNSGNIDATSRFPVTETERMEKGSMEKIPIEKAMEHSNIGTSEPQPTDMFTRRSAINVFGTVIAMVNLSSLAISPSQAQTEGAMTMGQYAMNKKTVSDAVSGGGLLVVAQWEAKDGQADKVADILRRFLPEAQSDPGAKLFLISRGRENPAQFLFYELFRDEAALKAHQESGYFKTFIAGEALPLLSKRERAQYALL
ncbi:MAG TPA: antibiotic biosynthesis monooxygenase family protein [Bradyrhizobium sp.]|nr:antibiotic biosynthesis monooxygenase family protein [Bradyrhizobium sp.]